MYMKLQQNMILVTTNFINHFLKNYKIDFAKILQVDFYYINASMIQKSNHCNARIMKYKQNGYRWQYIILKIWQTNLTWNCLGLCILMIPLCYPKITRIHFIVLKMYANQFLHCIKIKLYVLNEKKSRKHSSCVAILPPNWRFSMPSCNARKQIEVVATICWNLCLV